MMWFDDGYVIQMMRICFQVDFRVTKQKGVAVSHFMTVDLLFPVDFWSVFSSPTVMTTKSRPKLTEIGVIS